MRKHLLLPAVVVVSCLLASFLLPPAVSACSFSQRIHSLEAGSLKITVFIGGKPAPGMRVTWGRREPKPPQPKEVSDEVEAGEAETPDQAPPKAVSEGDKFEWIAVGEAVTDESGTVTFKVNKGMYSVGTARGELSSTAAIDITAENDTTAPVAIQWPTLDRVESQTLNGTLLARPDRRAAEPSLADFMHPRPLIPYEGARVALLDLDDKEIANTVADTAGRFMLPPQPPGFYLLAIKGPQKSEAFASHLYAQKGLLELSHHAKFPDLNIKMEAICGGFHQYAPTH